MRHRAGRTGCRRGGWRGRRGFTLIELLVALTLLGLISVVLFGGLRFGTRAWEAGDERADRLAQIEAVQGVLRRHIAQAVMPHARGRPGGAGAPFIGEEDRFRLVTLVPAHIGIGGLYRIELASVDAGAAKRLDLVWRLYRPDEPEALDDTLDEEETPTGGRRALLEGIERASFAYYGMDETVDRAEWRERWDGAMGLPELIAVNVTFPPGDSRSWPEFVVRLRLARAGAAR
ncbi:MAG: prepilin-type N-terminal cleavage/methylation domain-containing protein [Kiloniellaceae bacterium]